MSLFMIFRLTTLKGNAKAPVVDLLKLNTLRGTKTALLAPKRYDKYPLPSLFVWELGLKYHQGGRLFLEESSSINEFFEVFVFEVLGLVSYFSRHTLSYTLKLSCKFWFDPLVAIEANESHSKNVEMLLILYSNPNMAWSSRCCGQASFPRGGGGTFL